jgi:histidyl-tRNA synthetase
MKIPPVKGTRDFYPPEMAIRNFIIDGWKAASLRNGFEEYDSPIFEYLKMYQIKSGDEIVEQLFNLTDRGGRDLAIRPEITPSLARMVNQQINALPRPIKWFSVPRLCRAERPQKGRLREFFQWNIDIIGVDDVIADAEVIFTTIDYLRNLGLTDKDIKVKISSRKLLSAVLKNIGIPEKKLDSLYVLLDKKAKLPDETFDKLLAEQVSDSEMAGKIKTFMGIKKVSQIKEKVGFDDRVDEAIDELAMLVDLLGRMSVKNYCQFDPSIVRGLAYYTGIVFEVHDVVGELRAICGGGRYDNLLKDFGGPQISATGMGMGDCVLEILLKEKGLLKSKQLKLDYFVACADNQYFEKAVELTARLRLAGASAAFSYKATGLGKQMKQASANGAKKCIIIGEEFEAGQLAIKDMGTGEQELVAIEDFFEKINN